MTRAVKPSDTLTNFRRRSGRGTGTHKVSLIKAVDEPRQVLWLNRWKEIFTHRYNAVCQWHFSIFRSSLTILALFLLSERIGLPLWSNWPNYKRLGMLKLLISIQSTIFFTKKSVISPLALHTMNIIMVSAYNVLDCETYVSVLDGARLCKYALRTHVCQTRLCCAVRGAGTRVSPFFRLVIIG